MRSTTRALLSAAFVVLVGCGGGSNAAVPDALETPQKAFERQIRFLAAGQSGRAYKELHPAHQAIVPEALYEKCISDAGSFDIGSVKINEVYDEETSIPGTDIRVASKAITATIEVKRGLLKSSDTDTFHEILVDGAWRFSLSDIEDYKAGKCP